MTSTQRKSSLLKLSYNVTKPFPFRWFTIFVVAEFAVALVLFSLMSFVTSGYELVSEYSSDPNATVSQTLLPGIPSYFTSKSKASCQSIELDVGSSFSTNNSALTYTLDSVQQDGTTATSVVYHNNFLSQCSIHGVQILMSTTDRNAAQVAYMRYIADLSATITCSISTESSDSVVNFTAKYTYIPSTSISGRLTVFSGRNMTSKASLFWGEEALAMYWTQLTNAYTVDFMKSAASGPMAWTRAALYLVPTQTNDIMSPSFFAATEMLVALDANNQVFVAFNTEPVDADTMTTGQLPQTTGPQPFWYAAYSLAKVFHSTVMTDLGQTQYKPNILSDANLLQYFTSNFSNIDATVVNAGSMLQRQGWIAEDYETQKDTTGPLVVHPSVISARYFCQIPQRKSAGNLVLSIIIADFVLLQILWKVTMWTATFFVGQKDSKANWCEGCLAVRDDNDPKSPDEKRNASLRQTEFLLKPQPNHYVQEVETPSVS